MIKFKSFDDVRFYLGVRCVSITDLNSRQMVWLVLCFYRMRQGSIL